MPMNNAHDAKALKSSAYCHMRLWEMFMQTHNIVLDLCVAHIGVL